MLQVLHFLTFFTCFHLRVQMLHALQPNKKLSETWWTHNGHECMLQKIPLCMLCIDMHCTCFGCSCWVSQATFVDSAHLHIALMQKARKETAPRIWESLCQSFTVHYQRCHSVGFEGHWETFCMPGPCRHWKPRAPKALHRCHHLNMPLYLFKSIHCNLIN